MIDSYPLPLSTQSLAELVPCSHGTGCPLGVDAPGIANAILAGDLERAHRLARGSNPFASTCGNGCHAPCEAACRRGRYGAPTAIAALEAYAAAIPTPNGGSASDPCTSAFDSRSVAGALGLGVLAAIEAPRSGKKIAIVGAGPAGLACAHDLALLGHRCIVFDVRSEPGGLLTGAIPDFRFPVHAARAECAAVLGQHADFRGGTGIGQRRTLGMLFAAGVDAIFMAVGASEPRDATLEEPLRHPDVVDAMQVLTREIPAAERVVVVGDGDLAIDAARVSVRRDRSPDTDRPVHVDLVLSAALHRASLAPAMLAAAAQEGVHLHHGWRARRVVTDPDTGLVTGVEIVHAEEKLKTFLPCDRVVLAGPRAPAASLFAGELSVSADGFFVADQAALRTSMPNVWAGGACVFGHRSIAHATADGKRAAWGIHAALSGIQLAPVLHSAWIETEHRNGRTSAALEASRRALPVLEGPLAQLRPSDPPRSTRDILQEARRCFDCTELPSIDATCTGCGKCVDICPAKALAMKNARPVLDQDICNRCGKCVEICPEDAISMVRAVWEERLMVVPQTPVAPV